MDAAPPLPSKRHLLAWVLAAIAGLAAFVALLPHVDPDGTARFGLTEATAETRARAILDARGLLPDTTGATVDVRRRRSGLLIDSLFRRHGRAEALARLRAGATAAPVYHWEVTWRPPASGGYGPRPAIRTVRLAPDGTLLGLDVPAIRPEQVRPDVAAAAEVGATAPPVPGDTLALPVAVVRTPTRAGDSARVVRRPRPQAGTALDADPRWAALARHHLAYTALARAGLAVDSVREAERPGLFAARVYLSTRDRTAPPHYAEVEVTEAGALVGLTDGVRPRALRGTVEAGLTAGVVRGYVAGALYLGFLVVTLVGFVRRLNAKQIDTRGAARDGTLVAVLAATWWLSASAGGILESSQTASQAAVIIAINTVFLALVGGLIGMAASGVAESVARPLWPEKLHTLVLLRRGALHDVRLGWSLVRGVAAAALALALVAALHFTPGLRISNPDAVAFGNDAVVSLVGYAVGWPFTIGWFLVLGMVVPVVARWGQGRGRWAVWAALALAVAAMVNFFDGRPDPAMLLVGAVVGAVAVALFVRYDAVTAIGAVGFVGLLWFTREGWLAEGAGTLSDALLAFAVVGVALFVGAGAAYAGRETGPAGGYVPAYLLDREREARLQRELEIAHNIQQRFLPGRMPRVPGLDVAAVCYPAQEVGGDLYDFVPLGPGRLAVVIGDVSGKGIGAAFVMTLVKGFVQTLAAEGLGPADVLRRMNRLYRANVPRGVFVSLIYGVFDVGAGRLTLARAGHNPVIVRRGTGGDRTDVVQPAGMAVGMADGALFDASLEEHTLPFAPGDVLVFYTDGFSEAMDVGRALYGDDRLADEVGRAPAPTAQAVLDAAVADVTRFAGEAPQHDDMTMVVVRATDGAVPAADGHPFAPPAHARA